MSWLAAAQAHALCDAPREACGLVVRVDGRDAYIACGNVAADAADFEIAAADYVRCEDMGEIVGVFHSHPNGLAAPSERDVSAQAASGLPWYIFGGYGRWVILNA